MSSEGRGRAPARAGPFPRGHRSARPPLPVFLGPASCGSEGGRQRMWESVRLASSGSAPDAPGARAASPESPRDRGAGSPPADEPAAAAPTDSRPASSTRAQPPGREHMRGGKGVGSRAHLALGRQWRELFPSLRGSGWGSHFTPTFTLWGTWRRFSPWAPAPGTLTLAPHLPTRPRQSCVWLFASSF